MALRTFGENITGRITVINDKVIVTTTNLMCGMKVRNIEEEEEVEEEEEEEEDEETSEFLL